METIDPAFDVILTFAFIKLKQILISLYLMDKAMAVKKFKQATNQFVFDQLFGCIVTLFSIFLLLIFWDLVLIFYCMLNGVYQQFKQQ